MSTQRELVLELELCNVKQELFVTSKQLLEYEFAKNRARIIELNQQLSQYKNTEPEPEPEPEKIKSTRQ
ncbi:hypothetical protein J9B46_10510 [Klebsiella pneumoniae]|nr:hypothetical protein [Klebsiella pneumoniae]